MSFLTGSRVYGTPREDSDIDLVVLVRHSEIAILEKLSENTTDKVVCTSDKEHGLSSGSFRFGQINLIAVTKPEHYDIWKRGTANLLSKKEALGRSITREEACKHFKELRDGAKAKDVPQVPTDIPPGDEISLLLSQVSSGQQID